MFKRVVFLVLIVIVLVLLVVGGYVGYRLFGTENGMRAWFLRTGPNGLGEVTASNLGYSTEKTMVNDPRSGADSDIYVMNLHSDHRSLLFALESFGGTWKMTEILNNANSVTLNGKPTISMGPNGIVYLNVPVLVNYGGGTFTMIQGFELAKELPTPADLK